MSEHRLQQIIQSYDAWNLISYSCETDAIEDNSPYAQNDPLLSKATKIIITKINVVLKCRKIFEATIPCTCSIETITQDCDFHFILGVHQLPRVLE